MRVMRSQRGAALVVAILVMLVLSALGMVAVKAAIDGNWQSGSYRVKAQATSFSDSVNQLGLARAGTRADTVYDMMRRQANWESGQTSVIDDGGTEIVEQIGAAAFRRGGYQIWVPQEDPGDGKASLYALLGGNERFLEDGAIRGVESIERMGVDYRYIVRDPILGPPSPGFGDEYCFVRVTVASEAGIGRGVEEEERVLRRMRGVARNSADAFIGPIACGAQ